MAKRRSVSLSSSEEGRDEVNEQQSGTLPSGESGGDDAVLSAVRLGTRTSMPKWALIAVLSLAAHEPFYHHSAKSFLRENIVAPYNDWVASMEREAEYEQMPLDFKDALKADQKEVAERNKDRLQRIEARKAEAQVFKAKLYQEYAVTPYGDIFFPVEYFDQGVADDEMAVAKPYFRIVADGITVADRSAPTHGELKDIVKAYMPPGSYDRTKTSVVHTLVHQLGPKSQNCVPRNRLMIMALATKYPALQKNIYFQKFGDHDRALYDVGGTRYIMEGDVPTFPDKKTEEKKNEVMPFEVWLALYSGHKRAEFEDRIEKHGPQSADREKPADYPRATDNLVQEGFWDNDLDNVGTAEGWFASGTGTGDTPGPDGAPGGVADDAGTTDQQDMSDPESPSLLEREEDTRNLVTPMEPQSNKVGYLDFPEVTKEDIEKFRADASEDLWLIQIRMATTLHKEAARALIDMSKDPKHRRFRRLVFEKLTTMDEETAEVLSEFQGNIFFNGFSAVPIHVMRGLSPTRASLNFKAPIISEDALAAYVGEMPGNRLTEFFDINDLLPEDADSTFDVPKDMTGSSTVERRHRGGLILEDCVGLTAGATDVLSRFTGPVTLKNIPLSKENIEDIARLEQPLFLENIPPANLEGLVNAKANSITLKYDQEFPVEAAKAIYQFQGHLFIQSETMSTEAARYLGQKKAETRFSGRLTVRVAQLTDETLKEIAQQEGNLEIVTDEIFIDEELGTILAAKERRVSLTGKMRFSNEGATRLGGYRGEELSLKQVGGFSAEVLQQLAHCHTRLDLGRLTVTDDVAKALSVHKGDLGFIANGPVSLDAFRDLLKIDGNLHLGEVRLVTLEMAKALRARFRNPALARHRVVMSSADVVSKRAAIILHEINGGDQHGRKVMIDDIKGQKMNAPFRPEIVWEEE